VASFGTNLLRGRIIVKIAVWTFCLLVATPAFAGSFDVPATSLEENLGAFIEQMGWQADAQAEKKSCDSNGQNCSVAAPAPQKCSRLQSGAPSCFVVVFKVMIIAVGTEIPARTTLIQLLLEYAPDPGGKNVSQAVTTVMMAYDASIIKDIDNFTRIRRSLLEAGSAHKALTLEGVEARYSVVIKKLPAGSPLDETAVLEVTPR